MSSFAVSRVLGSVLCFEIALINAAGSAAYRVEGFTLDEQLPQGSSAYKSYACKPSDSFEGLTWCQRAERRASSGAFYSSSIMHLDDGTAIYLMANIGPVRMNRSAVNREIEDLSRENGERPTSIKWSTPRSGLPVSVIVLWGQIELQALMPEEIETLAAGNSLERGILVDGLGDLVRSARQGLPVYRITGGPGYLYAASFDAGGQGHRHYVAADISKPAIKRFEPILRQILQEDQSRPADDYGLWPKLGVVMRSLALNSSPGVASQILDKAFEKYPSTKLRSHVWPLIPLGTLKNLSSHRYWLFDTYGPNTKYPEIRKAIQEFLVRNPSERFNEFLYYTIGEFDKAKQFNPHSIIEDVLTYAIGYRHLDALLLDTAAVLNMSKHELMEADDTTVEPVNDKLVDLNKQPERYNGKLLGKVVPNFGARAAEIQPYFEHVLREEKSPQRDDAAYILGWLSFHQGKFEQALSYLAQAMSLGNRDFTEPALKQTVRVLMRLPAQEQMTIVESNSAFEKQPALWYTAARSAYREFNYDLAIKCATEGLERMNVSIDTETTDAERIDETLLKLAPQNTDNQSTPESREGVDDPLFGGLYEKYEYEPDSIFANCNLSELIYVLYASKEMLEYEKYLGTAHQDAAKRVREIVFKYSMIVDPELSKKRTEQSEAHKDLRQAVHLIDITLKAIPNSSDSQKLREWLYYRRVRILVQFAPEKVSEAVAAMAKEYPKAKLLNDALAEEVHAEGVRLKDINAAERTFQKLRDTFPRGNAVDNAYTWMAIAYHCARRANQARKIDRDIMQLFPLTRHARYARERSSSFHGEVCGWPEGKSDQ